MRPLAVADDIVPVAVRVEADMEAVVLREGDWEGLRVEREGEKVRD